MTNGWYEVTRSFIDKLTPSKLMEYAKECYGIDPDNDIGEIRDELFNKMIGKDVENEDSFNL